jgi:site-specific recombinase XerD
LRVKDLNSGQKQVIVRDGKGMESRVKMLPASLVEELQIHSFRHSFAKQLLQDGYDIRTVQELLGHKDVKTTMIYTHILNRGGKGVRSPLDP